MLDVQTALLHPQLVQRLPLVGLGVVQEHNDGTVQVPKQVTEEHADLLLPDVLEIELVVEAQTMSPRADGDSRDDRDFVPPIAMTMNRSLPPWRPGPDHIRDQQEPGFVGEDDVGAQPRSVFFTRGQSSRFQRSMASSFRSAARVSGFWWLQPRRCINRPT